MNTVGGGFVTTHHLQQVALTLPFIVFERVRVGTELVSSPQICLQEVSTRIEAPVIWREIVDKALLHRLRHPILSEESCVELTTVEREQNTWTMIIKRKRCNLNILVRTQRLFVWKLKFGASWRNKLKKPTRVRRRLVFILANWDREVQNRKEPKFVA